uniref:NADH:ubiquinone reductase (H(+)-translocating) n=1 Tax=Synergus sp. 1 DYB-20230501 TaxID=3136278 RepID=A0AAU6QCE7_9HYME
MIYNLYMYMLLILSLNMFMFSLIFYLLKKVIFIEWFIYSLNSCNFEFIIFLDWMMLMFMSVVMFISSMVMLYSKDYMSMDYKNKYFIMILMMFIISMMLMIMSPNILSIILGWDGLGLISYCLIIYYQNSSSYNSGMLTLLMNRIGDVMLLMMIYLLMNLGSWNLMFFKFNNYLFIYLFMVMIMTKSAQIPFSSWLPAAMAAPTPVSSLVHSSTLVTAGVYLLIRFNKLFSFNKINFLIMFISIFTMFISSINAMMEFDLKKIIAFSTLSQLGLMMLMLSMNLSNFVFFHLISHAMFKSLLFLCSGVMIHFMSGIQDIRFMGYLVNDVPLVVMYFNISNLSLCGFPFLQGFIQDLLYEMSLNLNLNLFMYHIMYVCIMLTMIYSLRLMYYLVMNFNLMYSLSFKYDSMLMSVSMILLFLMSIIFGSLINWMMFSSVMISVVDFYIKINLYIMMLFSLMIFFILNFLNLKLKFLLNKLIKVLSLFFLLLKVMLFNNKNLLMISKMYIKLNENSWNEYLSKMMMMFMFNNMNKLYMNMFMNLYMMMMFMFMYIMLIYYVIC